MSAELAVRLRSAWAGRVSGCQLGKAVELLSMRHGHAELARYLADTGALPLRDYVPLVPGGLGDQLHAASCRGR